MVLFSVYSLLGQSLTEITTSTFNAMVGDGASGSCALVFAGNNVQIEHRTSTGVTDAILVRESELKGDKLYNAYQTQGAVATYACQGYNVYFAAFNGNPVSGVPTGNQKNNLYKKTTAGLVKIAEADKSFTYTQNGTKITAIYYTWTSFILNSGSRITAYMHVQLTVGGNQLYRVMDISSATNPSAIGPINDPATLVNGCTTTQNFWAGDKTNPIQLGWDIRRTDAKGTTKTFASMVSGDYVDGNATFTDCTSTTSTNIYTKGSTNTLHVGQFTDGSDKETILFEGNILDGVPVTTITAMVVLPDNSGILIIMGSQVFLVSSSPKRIATPAGVPQVLFCNGDSCFVLSSDSSIHLFRYKPQQLVPQPFIKKVVNGASFVPGFAPQTWATIFGSGLGTQGYSTLDDPYHAGGASVTVCFSKAVVNYNSGRRTDADDQINFLVPEGFSPGQVCPVTVTTAGGTSTPPFNITISDQSWGVFTYVLPAIKPNDTSVTLPIVTSSNGSIVGPTDHGQIPIYMGDIGVAWGTGCNSSAPPPTITIGNLNTQVVYAGVSPGSLGLCQLNFVVPQFSTAGTYDFSINNYVVGPLAVQ